MSRNILNDHPFSDEEIQYLIDRGRDREIAINKELFPEGVNSVAAEDDSDETVVLELSQKVYDYVSSRSVDELKTDLSNAGLNPEGDETALRVALAQHLQELEDNADA